MKKPIRTVRWMLPLLLLSACFSCATNAPLEMLSYPAVEGDHQSRMVIFLRGRGGSHTDFETYGFVDEIRRRGLSYDMVAPDSHFGYYIGRSLVPRLKSDIIDPAKAAGYREIWLVGASMGGLGALIYHKNHPGDIAGIYIISPYLGGRDVISGIRSAGGLKQWSPGVYDAEKHWDIMLWHWLKDQAETGWTEAPIYLGYGTEDMFIDAQRLLTEALPSSRVFTTGGGHTSSAMKQVWVDFLEAGVMK
ncbi:MAG: alpha/beta fold hydrolase [Desulfobacterales bacterium]